ncbi:helix-turn-helix transcriptional regulator [Acidobacteria bacterium AB60]|nr:helix-turn-helix transcriptional regulator [Acidobacteria bacterium AB60]
MRQPLLVRENDPGRGISVTSHARDYARDSRVSLHAHGSDQLVYASRGVMEIAAGEHLWVLPPHFGLWVPARTAHRIHMHERVGMRTLYLRPGIFARWAGCTVFHVTPLLRQLIFEIVRRERLRARDGLDGALLQVLVAQLERATPVPTGITLPRDERAAAVAQRVLEDVASRRSLGDLCKSAGASVRTMQRIFQREVGLDFESWRRQVRLMRGVQLLVSGRSVKEVADAVGYADTSTFVALFRSVFERPPKAWVLGLPSERSDEEE